MQDYAELLTILTDVAPLVLTTLILGAIVLLVLYIVLKVVIPALRESIQMAEVQRQAWKSIIDEQARLNKLMMEEVQRDLTEERIERKRLAERIAEMEVELAKKDTRIEELQAEINVLRKALSDKELVIQGLRDELDRVKDDRKKVEKERDDLLHRIEALELAQRAEKSDGSKSFVTPEVKSDPSAATSN